MENYIVINGKKLELTEEQLQALGIEIKKKRNNPFNTVLNYKDSYLAITGNGVYPVNYTSSKLDEECIANANSFNDYKFVDQIYLHELLNRKLLKYAWDNEAEDCDWTHAHNEHWYIGCNHGRVNIYKTWSICSKALGVVYFSRQEVAEQAIKDVIEPFRREHPEFVW